MFICLVSFSQDTLIGKKIIFNKTGCAALKKWNVHPFVFMKDNYGELFTIVGFSQIPGDLMSGKYLLVNDKKDSAESKPFSLSAQIKKGNAFFENQFDEFLKKYSAETLVSLMSGNLNLGMNEEEVKIALGLPDDIHNTIYTNVKSVQWVYGENIFLYFESGKLIAIQD